MLVIDILEYDVVDSDENNLNIHENIQYSKQYIK